jgi:sugar/nucleoside kinase (ribokinase family)
LQFAICNLHFYYRFEQMIRDHDILGLGCVAIDELLYVASYPAADSKAKVLRWERHCGGLTATALVAAARVGSRCAYAGILGNDPLSEWALDQLSREGIDVSSVRRIEDARPIHSVIIVDEATKSRNIFFYLEGFYGAQADWPPEQLIRSVRVLYVDHIGVAGMLRAAQIARQTGIPIVADFEGQDDPGFAELLAIVDHLILSQELAQKVTSAPDARTAAKSLWTDRRSAVVVTCGAEGCWYVGAEQPNHCHHRAAYSVPAVDTTGCGDVFHGAYASALSRNLDLHARIQFASATAALKALCHGGQAGIPTRSAVEAFLHEQQQGQKS